MHASSHHTMQGMEGPVGSHESEDSSQGSANTTALTGLILDESKVSKLESCLTDFSRRLEDLKVSPLLEEMRVQVLSGLMYVVG